MDAQWQDSFQTHSDEDETCVLALVWLCVRQAYRYALDHLSALPIALLTQNVDSKI